MEPASLRSLDFFDDSGQQTSHSQRAPPHFTALVGTACDIWEFLEPALPLGPASQQQGLVSLRVLCSASMGPLCSPHNKCAMAGSSSPTHYIFPSVRQWWPVLRCSQEDGMEATPPSYGDQDLPGGGASRRSPQRQSPLRPLVQGHTVRTSGVWGVPAYTAAMEYLTHALTTRNNVHTGSSCKHFSRPSNDRPTPGRPPQADVFGVAWHPSRPHQFVTASDGPNLYVWHARRHGLMVRGSRSFDTPQASKTARNQRLTPAVPPHTLLASS